MASVNIPIKWYTWQETSRELWIFKGFLKLANADINISCLLKGGEHKELRRSITNDNKIIYKFNDKSLARCRYKQKQNLWNLSATLVCSTQSPSRVSNSSYFLSSSSWSLWSSRIRCPGEALNLCEILKVPIFVRVFFIFIRNLDLQSGV